MSIDNNAIVNHTCDNISHIYNSVNLAINETSDDTQILKNKNLTDPSNTFPSTVINNVPLGSIFGQIAVWNGSTWGLESNSIGIGENAGLTFQSQQTISLGTNSGRNNQNSGAISIGFSAGRTSQGTHSIAIGLVAGSSTQGLESIAIGMNAAQLSQGDKAISIGSIAGLNNQKFQAISMGYRSGAFEQGTNSIAVGVESGFTNQGQNSVAIGFQAGMTAQPSNSIVLNASNTPISGITSNSCYINPIRTVPTGGGSSSNIMCYDDINKEVVQASNINFLNSVSFPSGSATQNSVNFSTPGTGIYSSSTNSLDFSTAGVNRINLTSSRLNSSVALQLPSGSNTLPSFYFSETNSGIFRPGTNQVAITTNGTTRLNVGTGVITCALALALPTVGGTATNLDYYERTTQTMIMRHSNVATFNWTITLIRIGTHIEYHFPDDSTLYTISGQNRTIDSETNTIPSRFRPSSNQVFPYLYLTGGLVWTSGKILINSNGSLSISPLNGNFNIGDQIYIQRQSNSVFI